MSEYACDAEGNYNASTRAYKDNPSIELYLKLRREDPDNEIEISFLGGLEALSCLEPKLRKFGFDPQLVASIMDADPDAISEFVPSDYGEDNFCKSNRQNREDPSYPTTISGAQSSH